MLSIKSASAVALLFASSVTAQFNYTVDPATVLPDIRANWCAGQQNTCEILCDASASENECSPATFNYTCLCAANNSAPGLQYYTISMPSYLCEQQFSICNELQVSAAGKAKCLATKKEFCGTLDPASYQPAAASESASASGSSSTAAPTASGTGAAAAPTTSTSAGLAPTTVATLGKGAFAVGIAAFGLLI